MLIKISTEMLSIVVAVMVALWANQWWSDKQLQQNVHKMVQNIDAEMQENLAKIEASHQYHKNQIELIKQAFSEAKQQFHEQDAQLVNQRLYERGVFKPADINFTNWEIAKDKGLLSEISQEQLRLYKPAYNMMNRYVDEYRSIRENQLIVQLLAKKDTEILELTYSALNELWWAEKAAMLKLNQAIAQEKKAIKE